MTKLSEQQEKFCRNIVEGMSQTDAYEAAGYKGDRKSLQDNASRLIGNDRIVARIKELRQKAAEATEINAEWLLRESVDTYKAARDDGAYGPANALLKTIGVYSGDWNENSTRENLHKYAEDFSEEELAAIASGSGTGAAESTDSPAKPPSVH